VKTETHPAASESFSNPEKGVAKVRARPHLHVFSCVLFTLSRIAVSHYAAARTDCIQGAELECVINDLFLPMHSALWAVHLKLKPITLSNWISLKLRSGIYLSSLSLSLSMPESTKHEEMCWILLCVVQIYLSLFSH
jgi:hypothetical protein